MTDFKDINQALASLINALKPTERKKFNSRLIRRLRQQNQKRIQQQVNPNGTKFARRKSKARRVMFRRLRTTRFMRTRTTANQATIYFQGNSNYIATVHHYGLRGKVSKKGKRLEVKYTKRELLGITPTDIEIINNELLDHLSLH